jgi:hypothetical protein
LPISHCGLQISGELAYDAGALLSLEAKPIEALQMNTL